MTEANSVRPTRPVVVPARGRRGWAGPVAAVAVAVAGVVWPGAVLAAGADPAVAAPGVSAPRPYLRVVDDAGAGTTTLEIAARSFRRADGTGPTVHLAGAVHIADAGFYEAMQGFLDAQTVVLFEGVKPAGARSLPEDASDERRAAVTASRLKVLAAAVERFAERHGRLPASMEELARLSDGRLAAHVAIVAQDAWGRAVTIETDGADAPGKDGPAGDRASGGGTRFALRSLGADGAPGGEGAGADLRQIGRAVVARAAGDGEPDRPDRVPPPQKEVPPKNVQQKLADALGLKFQLDHIDSTKANWRSSDLSLDEVQEKLEAAGAGTAILDVLDPGSLSAKLAGVLIGFVGSNKTMATSTKLMMVEMLSQVGPEMGEPAGGEPAADRPVAEKPAAVSPARSARRGMLASMQPMMQVIVHDRNRVVVEDLRSIIAREPGVTSVAAFYGAGHMPDLERRLASELGLLPTGEDRWFPAITVRWSDAGLTAKSVDRMRASIRRTVGGMMR